MVWYLVKYRDTFTFTSTVEVKGACQSEYLGESQTQSDEFAS
jgi:hypothetical protein